MTALVLGLASTAVALANGADRETTQWYGYFGGFIGGSLGLLAYLVGLITNLY